MAWVKSEADSGVVVARGGAFCGFSLYIKDGVAKFGIHREQEGPAYIAAGREKVVGRGSTWPASSSSDRIELYVERQAGGDGEDARLHPRQLRPGDGDRLRRRATARPRSPTPSRASSTK